MELGEEIDASDVEVGKDYAFVDEAGRVKPATVLRKIEHPHETTELSIQVHNVPVAPAFLRGKSALYFFNAWSRERIYELPPRRGTVVGELAIAKKIPRDVTGTIVSYLKPFKPGPTPPEERKRQAKATEEGKAKLREEVVTAESAAVGRGRRRKTRRRQTRRRKRFT